MDNDQRRIGRLIARLDRRRWRLDDWVILGCAAVVGSWISAMVLYIVYKALGY